MVLMIRKAVRNSEDTEERETIPGRSHQGSAPEECWNSKAVQPQSSSREISSHQSRSSGASSFKIWFRTLSFVCLLSYGLGIFYTDSKENDFPRLGRRAQPFDPENDDLDVDVDEDGYISQKEYHIAMRPRHALDRWISKLNFKMSDRNSK